MTRKHLLVNDCLVGAILYLRRPARVGLSSRIQSSSFVGYKMEMFEDLFEYCTLGNIFLAVIFMLILNQLIELYQFRNMPPGPRLTSLPLIGNLLSFDSGESLRELTARFVCIYIVRNLIKLPRLSIFEANNTWPGRTRANSNISKFGKEKKIGKKFRKFQILAVVALDLTKTLLIEIYVTTSMINISQLNFSRFHARV